jgi:hypothetical protein
MRLRYRHAIDEKRDGGAFVREHVGRVRCCIVVVVHKY